MSNLLHKVKDVFTGHHHGSGNNESSNAGDTYNSGDNLGANTNAQDYGTGDYNSKPMTSGDNYNAPGYTSGAYQDTRMPGRMPPDRVPNQMPGRMEDPGAGNRYESSALENENRGAGGYGASNQQDPNMFNRGNETGDVYSQQNMRRDNYDSGGNMDSANKMKDNETGPSDSQPVSDIYSSNELNSSKYDKIKKDPDNYGATNQGSSSGYDATTRTGDYGSDIGPHLYEPPLRGTGLDDMESDVREPQGAGEMGKESQNQGTYGDPMGQTRSYTSDYGAKGENAGGNMNAGTHGYNTRSKNTDSSMADQVEARAETEANQRMDQQGFRGSAAGGSSYNAPEPDSGAHSSNLLNKLDPRVRSSDFEDNAMGSQRGN